MIECVGCDLDRTGVAYGSIGALDPQSNGHTPMRPILVVFRSIFPLVTVAGAVLLCGYVQFISTSLAPHAIFFTSRTAI